ALFCEVAAWLDMNCIFRLAAVSATICEGSSEPVPIWSDSEVISAACASSVWPHARDIASYQLVPPDPPLREPDGPPGPLANVAAPTNWLMRLLSVGIVIAMTPCACEARASGGLGGKRTGCTAEAGRAWTVADKCCVESGPRVYRRGCSHRVCSRARTHAAAPRERGGRGR